MNNHAWKLPIATKAFTKLKSDAFMFCTINKETESSVKHKQPISCKQQRGMLCICRLEHRRLQTKAYLLFLDPAQKYFEEARSQ